MARCIENEILMHLRKSSQLRHEVSIDDPLNVDWDGNELLLSDLLGSEPDAVNQDIERKAERTMLRSAVDRLSPRERTIMVLRFWVGQRPGGGRPPGHLPVLHIRLSASSSCAGTWKNRLSAPVEKAPRGVLFVCGHSPPEYWGGSPT